MNKIIDDKIKTGAEIWEIIKHPLLNESDWDKERRYNFTQYDKILSNGIIYSESKPIPNEQEIQEQSNKQRIQELKTIIPEKQLCGLDVTQEQEELKTLLGY